MNQTAAFVTRHRCGFFWVKCPVRWVNVEIRYDMQQMDSIMTVVFTLWAPWLSDKHEWWTNQVSSIGGQLAVCHQLNGSDCTCSTWVANFLSLFKYCKSVNGLHAMVEHSEALRSLKHVWAQRKSRALSWGINMTALISAAFWRPCVLSTARQASQRSLKQLSLTGSLGTPLLPAHCMGRCGKIGWRSVSGAVRTLPTTVCSKKPLGHLNKGSLLLHSNVS